MNTFSKRSEIDLRSIQLRSILVSLNHAGPISHLSWHLWKPGAHRSDTIALYKCYKEQSQACLVNNLLNHYWEIEPIYITVRQKHMVSPQKVLVDYCGDYPNKNLFLKWIYEHASNFTTFKKNIELFQPRLKVVKTITSVHSTIVCLYYSPFFYSLFSILVSSKFRPLRRNLVWTRTSVDREVMVIVEIFKYSPILVYNSLPLMI